MVSGYVLYYLSQNYWEQPRRSVAVLPFENATGAEDTDYFSDGLTEEIRSLIVRLNEFNVVAPTSSSQFRDSGLTAAAIASRLGASAALLGSVRRLESRVSVTARLIDGDNGNELWSREFDDYELSNIDTITEEIAREVARALHIVLPVASERRLKNLGSTNVEAYDLYLRGRDYLRRPADEVNLGQAEGFIRQALALDPNFASAHAAMCQVHLSRYRLSRDASQFDQVESACQKTLDFDTENSEIHLALGSLYRTSGRYEDALREFENALELNASSPDAYIGLARAQVALDDTEAAEASFRQAIDLDVSYWASFQAMGNYLFNSGRYVEAAEFYQMFVGRAENDATAFNNLGAAYYFAGDFERAADAWDKSLENKPTRAAYSNTGSMYFYLGDFETAAQRYADAVSLAPKDHRLWGNLGDAYFFSPSMERAAEIAYRRAIELGEQRLTVNTLEADTASDLAYYYARIDDKTSARRYIGLALERAPDDMYVHYNSALVHTHFGEIDAALDAVERAVALEYQTELLSIDPGLQSLAGEDRFLQLVSNAGQGGPANQ